MLGEMVVGYSRYLNSSYLFLFCNKPAKNFYGVRTLTAESHAPIQARSLLVEPPLPLSKHTDCMDDPLHKK